MPVVVRLKPWPWFWHTWPSVRRRAHPDCKRQRCECNEKNPPSCRGYSGRLGGLDLLLLKRTLRISSVNKICLKQRGEGGGWSTTSKYECPEDGRSQRGLSRRSTQSFVSPAQAEAEGNSYARPKPYSLGARPTAMPAKFNDEEVDHVVHACQGRWASLDWQGMVTTGVDVPGSAAFESGLQTNHAKSVVL